MRTRVIGLSAALAVAASACISFRPPVAHTASAVATDTAFGVVAADVTGNGSNDVVVLTNTGVVRMQTCGIDCMTRQEKVVLAAPTDLATGDFDGDGIGDIAVTLAGADPVVLFGGMSGGGRPAGLTLADSVTVPSSDILGFRPDRVDVGDFNGDTHPDLLVNSIEVAYIPGDGFGGFGPRVVISSLLPSQGSRVYAFGDVDGDDDDEVVFRITGLFGGAMSVFGTNQPFTAPQIVGAPFALGDMDGDGRDDLVGPIGGEMVVQRSTGAGFATVSQPTPMTITHGLRNLTVRDIDTDGTADIIGYNGTLKRLTWFNGKGNGTVQLVGGNARLETTLDIFVADIALGDLDGNGRPEVIVARDGAPNAEIRVLRNNSFIGGDPH